MSVSPRSHAPEPGANATAGEASFVHGAGFSAWRGGQVSDGQRLGGLIAVFLRDLSRGLLRKLLWLAFLLPPLGLTIYVAARTQIAAFAVPQPEQASFVLSNLGLLFRVQLAWALLLQAGLVAPTIARDIRFGALLLYFSRPVRRRHYLLGRTAAAAIAVSAAVAISMVGLTLVQLIAFGWQPGGAGPDAASWAFWPLLLLGGVVASAVVAVLSTVVGFAAGVVARNPGLVPLLYGGSVLGSVGLSWVGQLIWQRNSLARSVDLHHALEAPFTFASRLVDTAEVPRFVLLDAGAGLALWAALAVVSWLTLERFISDPPLGRGRS